MILSGHLLTEEDREFLSSFKIMWESQEDGRLYLYSLEWCTEGYDYETMEDLGEDALFARFQEIIARSNGELPLISIEKCYFSEEAVPGHDEVGGSAIIITADKVEYIGTGEWLDGKISEYEDGFTSTTRRLDAPSKKLLAAAESALELLRKWHGTSEGVIVGLALKEAIDEVKGEYPEVVEEMPIGDDHLVKVMVACSNASGEPDFYFVKVRCTQEQYDNGDHYDAAKDAASERDYEGAMVAFDENDSAGKAMLPLFVWESAGIIDITTVTCKFCEKQVLAATAHGHDGGFVGDGCCWDERLRATE